MRESSGSGCKMLLVFGHLVDAPSFGYCQNLLGSIQSSSNGTSDYPEEILLMSRRLHQQHLALCLQPPDIKIL